MYLLALAVVHPTLGTIVATPAAARDATATVAARVSATAKRVAGNRRSTEVTRRVEAGVGGMGSWGMESGDVREGS